MEKQRELRESATYANAEFSIDKLRNELARRANAANISLIDPIDAFRLRNVNNTFYFEIDQSHWNAAGHQLVSEILSEELQKRVPKLQTPRSDQ